MPDDGPQQVRLAPVQMRTASSAGENGLESAASSVNHARSSPLMLWGACIIAVAAIVSLVYFVRTAARRAWMHYAAEIGGEYSAQSRFSPAFVSGTVNDHALFMQMSTSHEDDAPYYHTRVSTPITNPGMLFMGLRRKSMLEEAQTRNDKPAYEFGDADFDRRFLLVANDLDALKSILDIELRRHLLRYSDIEFYVSADVVEWRRAGELSDLGAIRKLNRDLIRVAAAIDSLPRRSLPLSQRLADEELIRKGV